MFGYPPAGHVVTDTRTARGAPRLSADSEKYNDALHLNFCSQIPMLRGTCEHVLVVWGVT